MNFLPHTDVDLNLLFNLVPAPQYISSQTIFLDLRCSMEVSKSVKFLPRVHTLFCGIWVTFCHVIRIPGWGKILLIGFLIFDSTEPKYPTELVGDPHFIVDSAFVFVSRINLQVKIMVKEMSSYYLRKCPSRYSYSKSISVSVQLPERWILSTRPIRRTRQAWNIIAIFKFTFNTNLVESLFLHSWSLEQ